MANSVTIRTSAPGAKQAAGEMAMLKTSIQGIGNKTGGPLGGLIGGMGPMSIGFGTAALAAGGLMSAAQGVGEWLGKGMKSAMEEEVSLGRLDTALQNNVKNWDGNRDAIDKAIAKHMELGFTDDDLRDSMGKLVVSTKDAGDAVRLQGLAMDVARGRNIDLASATDLVVKANNGQVGALRRVGIKIDANATSTEALNALIETYVGQAAEYGNTLEGTFKRGDIALQEMQEHLGSKFIPLFSSLAKTTTNDVIPAMENFVDLLTGDYDMDNTFIRQFLDMMAMIPGQVGESARNLIQSIKLDKMAEDIHDKFVEQSRLQAEKHAPDMRQIGAFMASEIADQYHDAGVRAFDGANEKVMRDFGTSFGRAWTTAEDRIGKIVKPTGANIMDGLADGIRDNADFVDDAMDDVIYAINHPLKMQREVARIEGALMGDKLGQALASKNPFIRSVAQQQAQILQDRWEQLTGQAWNGGNRAGGAWVDGFEHGFGGGPRITGIGGQIGGQSKNKKPSNQGTGQRSENRVTVNVNLTNREGNKHTKHYKNVQGPVFQGGF